MSRGNTSHIGYLVYGDDRWVPIRAVRLNDGMINYYGEYVTGPDEVVTVDQGAACTIVGVDGSQISWVPAVGPGDALTAAYGASLRVHQHQRILESQRPQRGTP